MRNAVKIRRRQSQIPFYVQHGAIISVCFLSVKGLSIQQYLGIVRRTPTIFNKEILSIAHALTGSHGPLLSETSVNLRRFKVDDCVTIQV